MILQRLTIQNFRPFYGEQEIFFSTDDDKRITLIHAENGVGKSAILSAILWCLYGRVIEGFEQPDDLLNHEAHDEGVDEFSVTLEFKGDDGKEYSVTRKSVGNKVVVRAFEIKDGSFVPITNAYNFINGVIPDSMADYFFFHGEGNIGKKGKSVRQAVRDILGFKLAEIALEDLEAIEQKFRREISSKSKDEGVKEIAKRIEEQEEERKSIKAEIRKTEPRINVLDERIADADSKLRSAPDIRRIQDDREKEEIRVRVFEAELVKLEHDKIGFISKFGWALFAKELADETMDFIDEKEIEGKIPSPFNETFINDLLSSKMCICKTPLGEGSKERAAVQSRLKDSGNAVLHSRVSKARSQIMRISMQVKEADDYWKKVQANLVRTRKLLTESEQKVKQLSAQIEASDKDEIVRIENQRSNDMAERARLNQKLGVLRRDLEMYSDQIPKLKVKEKVAMAKDSNLQLFNRRKAFVENLIQILSEELEGAEEQAMAEIEDGINDTLESISRKDYIAHLNKQTYELSYTKADGRNVGASTGERLLLNFAFISTLIDYCRDRTNSEDVFLVPGAIAPFVIDAPFGELDNQYKSQTASYLPEKSRQVVLLLSSSHWENVEESIEDHVGSEYVIVSKRKSKNETSKPEDPILIRGKQFFQSVYGQDRDQSEVIEVDW